MKKNIFGNIFRLMLIIAVILISYRVIVYDVLSIDTLVAEFINSIRSDSMDFFMKFITSFGNTATIFILLLLVVWLLTYMVKNKKLALFFLLSLIINVFMNQGIKLLVKRDRPVNSLFYVSGFSFPSGHAMVSMAFYGMLIYIFYKLVKKKWLKILLILGCSLLILLIGFSRVYLGVHYFSDVLVGFILSILYLDIVSVLLNKYKVFT